jgi:hypothetical protein
MGMCTAAPRIQPQQRKVPHWHSSTEDQRKAYEVKAFFFFLDPVAAFISQIYSNIHLNNIAAILCQIAQS